MKSYFIFGSHGANETPRDIIALCDDFSWGAALIAPIWFLWRGMWLHALITGVIFIGLYGVASQTDLSLLALTIFVLLSVWLGFEARFLYMEFLVARGFEHKKTLVAERAKLAEIVYMSSFEKNDLLNAQPTFIQGAQSSSDMIFSRNWDS